MNPGASWTGKDTQAPTVYLRFTTPKINKVSAVNWEGVNALVAMLEILNAEGFASKFWSILLGNHRHNYLLGEVD
jgi:hypothetical protein